MTTAPADIAPASFPALAYVCGDPFSEGLPRPIVLRLLAGLGRFTRSDYALYLTTSHWEIVRGEAYRIHGRSGPPPARRIPASVPGGCPVASDTTLSDVSQAKPPGTIGHQGAFLAFVHSKRDTMSGRLLYNDAAMEKALRAARGNRTRAAEILGCAVSTVSSYVQRSEHLQGVEHELIESLVDQAEAVVRDHLDGGNLIASFFVLKTRGKERGWSERVDISLSAGGDTPGANLPPSAQSYEQWLAQKSLTEGLLANTGQQPLDIQDAEIVSDTEKLERVTAERISEGR